MEGGRRGLKGRWRGGRGRGGGGGGEGKRLRYVEVPWFMKRV